MAADKVDLKSLKVFMLDFDVTQNTETGVDAVNSLVLFEDRINEFAAFRHFRTCFFVDGNFSLTFCYQNDIIDRKVFTVKKNFFHNSLSIQVYKTKNECV